MYRRRWSSFRIVGATRTVYILSAPYLILGFLRNGFYDALAILPLAVAGMWWADATGGSIGVAASDTRADSLGRFILEHGIASYFSILIAMLLCLVILRTARRVEVDGLPHPVTVTQPIDWASVALFAVLAGADLYFGPGSWLHRLAPLVVAALWAWFVRVHIYGRRRLWLPTEAGFHPPPRMMLTPGGRSALRACVAASTAPSMIAAQKAYRAAARHPGGRSTAAWRAYCRAREIDHAVATNQLAHAESLVKDNDFAGHDLVRAARGRFEFAAGRFEIARDLYEAAGTTRGRVPFRLRALRLEAGQAVHARNGRAADGWTWSARTSLVWNRRYTVVIVDLLRMVELVRARDPRLALLFTGHILGLIELLASTFSLSDLDPREARQLKLTAARTHRQTGDILVELCRPREAVGHYLTASDIYRQQGHRPGRGETQVLAGVTALQLGPEDASQEGQLLDLVLYGLVEIEHDRGALRDRDRRWALVTTHDALYSAVLATLSNVVWHTDRAAELALWLMESIRRNALSEAIRQRASLRTDALADYVRKLQNLEAQYQATEPERLGRSAPSAAPISVDLAETRKGTDQRFSDQLSEAISPGTVDLAAVQEVLGDRIALYYHCRVVGAELRVTAVLNTPTGTELHRTVLDATAGCPRCADQPISRPATPAHLIWLLNCHATGHATNALKTLPLSLPIWQRLAEALLPPGLADALRQRTGPDNAVPVLIIVPDTLVSTVPFAGLRPAPGIALTDLATIVFQPNLNLIPEPESPSEPAVAAVDRPTTIVTHLLGSTDFDREFRAIPTDHVLIPTEDQSTLINTITRLAPTGADLAVISSHGDLGDHSYDQFIYLRDGRVLSAMNAVLIHWPPTVVLAACWSAHLPERRQGEPFGLVTACLLGRAKNVVGGLAPVANKTEPARVLAGLTFAVADGVHPAIALRECVARQRRLARNSWPPAFEWAVLAVWSSQPPAPPTTARPAPPRRFWTSHAVSTSTEAADACQGRPVLPDGLIPKPAAPSRATNRADQPWTVVPETSGRDPVTSGPLKRAIAVGFSRSAGQVLTTRTFLVGVAETDARTWSVLATESPPAAGPGVEGHDGGVEVSLGDDDHYVTATRAFAEALDTGRRLAAHLGHRQLHPAHVIYGVLSEPDTDGSRWLDRHAVNAEDPRRRLIDDVFGQPLPPADTLRPAAWGTSRGELLTIAGGLALLGAYLGGKKLLRFGMSIVLLLILGLTAALHDAYGAPDTADKLAAAEAELTGVITIADREVPAVLVGQLANYHVSAALPGLAGKARQVVGDEIPTGLRGRYLFLVPATGLPSGIDSPATMTYRGHTYAADVTCAGAIAAQICLAVVRLPNAKTPAVTWKNLWIKPEVPGPLAEHALVLGEGAEEVVVADLAAFTAVGATAENPPIVQVRAQSAARPVRAITPVVLRGKNRDLPLLGFACGVSATDWRVLFPNDVVTLYAQGLASRLGGAPSGATAFAGIRVAPATQADADGSTGVVVTEVSYGRPADFAGIRTGDVILSVDNAPIHSQDDLIAVVQAHQPDDVLTVHFRRGETEGTTTIILAYRTTP